MEHLKIWISFIIAKQYLNFDRQQFIVENR